MVYPEGMEVISQDGAKSISKRSSFYNDKILLKNYNVYITPASGSGNLAVVKLSKELLRSFEEDVEVILLNKSKVQVSCKSASVANKIVNIFVASTTYNAYIPQQKVEVKGRIYFPKDISEKEAFEGMVVKNRINTNAPLPSIVEVYRVPYFEKNAKGDMIRVDSDFMLISFCGSHIPTHVLYENALLIPVQAYFEPVLQCKKCWFFGHSKRACRGKEKCSTCGLTHSGECTALPSCVNCRGVHCSNDKKCIEFEKRMKLSKEKAFKTVPMREVEETIAPFGSFNIFTDGNFPKIVPKVVLQSAVNHEVPNPIGKSKRRRVEKKNLNTVRLDEVVEVEVSSESALDEITNRIIRDLSLEKVFFTTIVEEVKNSTINGKELEKIFSDKIKSMLKPMAEDSVISINDRDEIAGPSGCS